MLLLRSFPVWEIGEVGEAIVCAYLPIAHQGRIKLDFLQGIGYSFVVSRRLEKDLNALEQYCEVTSQQKKKFALNGGDRLKFLNCQREPTGNITKRLLWSIVLMT